MPVKTFAEWRNAVKREWSKFAEVDLYLNEVGRNRLKSLRVMLAYAEFCDTATELLKWVRSGDNISVDELEAIANPNTYHIFSALDRIARREASEE